MKEILTGVVSVFIGLVGSLLIGGAFGLVCGFTYKVFKIVAGA